MINTDDRMHDLDALICTFKNAKYTVQTAVLKNDEKLFLMKQCKNLIIVLESMKKAQL